MLYQSAQLRDDTFDKETLPAEPTRNGFGYGLVEAGKEDERVVALCADLAESTRVHWFAEKFPERYIELGVAEQNLATVAAGLANYGKIPFIASYAAFSPGRNNEQIRTCASLSELPIKVVGAHAGVSVGPDGATHQALEDIALMRVQPNMTVVVPCDAEEAKKATRAAAKTDGPVYLRFAREKTPVFTTESTPFEIGRAQTFFVPKDGLEAKVGVIGCGPVLHNALIAAHMLEEDGIGVEVMNLSTIKPLDVDAVVDIARRTDAIVTVEEHQAAGGMGSAVAEVLAQHHPIPMKIMGVQDQFGQSGDPDELIAHYGLDAESIKAEILKFI